MAAEVAYIDFRLHHLIETETRPEFLIGKHEQGVFASMRAVEVRVRQLAGLDFDAVGVDLMNKAFGPNGLLTDRSAPKGEQEGTRMLFAGAYAVLRNPAGHRQVNYDDVSEAAEAVQPASLLMRILDRVEARLKAGARRSRPWTPDEVLESIGSAGQDVATVAIAIRGWAAARPKRRRRWRYRRHRSVIYRGRRHRGTLSELTNGRIEALLCVVDGWIECVRAHSGEPEAAGDTQPQAGLP